MTVAYTFASPLNILLRWRGSVWKEVLRHYLVFITAYLVINCIYRYAMPYPAQVAFENVIVAVKFWGHTIPLQFLLGFYISSVVSRWWDVWNYVSIPDKLAILFTANVKGGDERSVLLRRTFTRYANLLTTLVWKEISIKVKKRFPTNEHLVSAGLMTKEEFVLFEGTTAKHGRWFVPVMWMVAIARKCRNEKLITEFAFQRLLLEIYAHRGNGGMLTSFDWISVPLVYTQVVTLATYGYFLLLLIGRQHLMKDGVGEDPTTLDMYFPFDSTLEFVFYLGWFKIGEILRDPLGEDDDDFELNYYFDRNIHVGNMLCDELANINMPLKKDIYWNDREPEAPHTVASFREGRDPIPQWSLSDFVVKKEDQRLVHPITGERLEENDVSHVNGAASETSRL